MFMGIPENESHFSHLSIRVSSRLRSTLENEARRQQSTLNALVNRVLERYVAFGRIVDYDRSVTLERWSFEEIVEKSSAETLAQIGRSVGPRIVKRDFEFFGMALTLDNLISEHFEPAGAFSERFNLGVSRIDSHQELVLTHDYGRKWSGFLAEYYDKAIESVLGARPIIEVEDDFVTIGLGYGLPLRQRQRETRQ